MSAPDSAAHAVVGTTSSPAYVVPRRTNRFLESQPFHARVRRRAPGPHGALGYKDALGLGFGVFLIYLVSYALGHGRIFWEDEVLGWTLLHDPSWHHMVAAWKLGADGGGFAFYATGRAWFALFGASETSFRAYSATCFALAFAVLWLAARRFYGVATVAFALVVTWFFSPTILIHLSEGRFYGLLMLAVALCFYLACRAADVAGAPAWLCVCFLLAHGLLTSSHLLGIIYSATLLAGLAALDWGRGRLRPLLYASGALAWLLLLPQRTAIHASILVGKPYFWTTPPTLRRIVGAYSAFSSVLVLVEGGLLVLVALAAWKSTSGWKPILRQALEERRAAWVLTAALLAMPVEFALKSFVGTSIFIDRYLMPVSIAQVFVLAEALTLLDLDERLRRAGVPAVPVRRLAGAALAAGLVVWCTRHVPTAVMSKQDYTAALTESLPAGIPVLCEDAWTFTEIIGRQHASPVRYTYLLDWPQSLSPTAPRLEVTQFHLMENLRKAGYFSGSIAYRDEFLKAYPEFLVFDPGFPQPVPPMIGNPLVERFRHDPGYETLPFKRDAHGRTDVWLVCRDRCTVRPETIR